MIVHRFMSDKEYQRLIDGKTLTNTAKHAENGKKSTSVGFCFFTEPPEEAIHWLSFIVDTDWCVTFDIPNHLLHESKGCYRDPENDRFGSPAFVWRKEWCLMEYSTNTVRIIKSDKQFAKYAENLENELFGLILHGLLCGMAKDFSMQCDKIILK